jgi:hypothetical protein
VNAFQNRCPASRRFSKSLTKHFKASGSGFTELHTKLDADTLLDFAIHRRQNEFEKTIRVHSAMSRGTLMQ